ncbi:Ycf66 family protein [Chamaesiphon sp. VAR_48_metabat_135_sub]|uniref:Ycf66 family protein n=1 Tax=Chamaesiphon sp. VAR_48_metabat_135_sub TaxID=2964699 RepID=UPI00286C8DB1|nr:Ycf66 family protein [Chamaesiphon sp. VAR_48_metabat_135_sub]
MLAYILAVLVGTGSVGLYISAFFFPELHRKQDFIWSGVGFFYALALWIYARQETGGILVGQTASVALLGWFAWQTLKLRRQLVPVSQQTPMPTANKLKEQLGLKPSAPKVTKPTAKKPAATPKPSTPTKTTTPAVEPLAASSPIEPSVTQEAAPGNEPVSMPVQQFSPPASTDLAADDEAWIRLEVKPAPAPSQPLGKAVQPPTTASKPEASKSPAIIPETISTNVPTDTIQTTAELTSKDRGEGETG